ncbi:TetR/AcrR family transcriptional regulator [Pseudonocardia oroxyli]|uniref:Transcriptional regulator, TetR family n=1 Tax=Pseudonocardia oroxyli TaxID=366584 RepID=A0A1G7TWU9_PSEOR|nr:TetR/AcrR family transcriptional regulator [Pseudonocardia oroxyli]SDG39591.1 transcriptional regulator, TetR family [Pseudonocardia oroxyli]
MTRREEVVDAAERILEAEGPTSLTMRRLGAELQMRAPSLYKHVTGKDDIEAALQERALRSQAEALGPYADLPGMAQAYRRWASAHPRLYELTARRRLRRDRLPDGVEDAAAAPLLAAVGGDVPVARAVWAFAHGLVDLELADRFPEDADLDEVWRVGIAAFVPSGQTGDGGDTAAGAGITDRPPPEDDPPGRHS